MSTVGRCLCAREPRRGIDRVAACRADAVGLDALRRRTSAVRRAGAGACPGDYATTFGKVALPVTELAGRAAGLACLTAGLGLDLYALDFFETTVCGGR